MEINGYFLFIAITVIGFYLLDVVSNLLNLRALKPELPSEFEDVFDNEKYAQSQAYTRETTKFGLLDVTPRTRADERLARPALLQVPQDGLRGCEPHPPLRRGRALHTTESCERRRGWRRHGGQPGRPQGRREMRLLIEIGRSAHH